MSRLPFFSAFLIAAPLAAADGWGTIKGTAVFPGTPHPPQAIEVTKDKEVCLRNGPIFSEEYVVNAKNLGVKWVVVFLTRDDGTGKADFKTPLPIHPKLAAVPAQPVVVNVPCCRFEPHIAVVRKGQDFIVRNSAVIVHNANLQGRKAPSVNVVLPPDKEVKVAAVQWTPDPLPAIMSCAIHTWMRAYVFCFDHPYFAVTDDNGSFEIKNAPAGKYRLIAWQEGWGWTTDARERSKHGIPITIEDGKTTSVKLTVFKSPDD